MFAGRGGQLSSMASTSGAAGVGLPRFEPRWRQASEAAGERVGEDGAHLCRQWASVSLKVGPIVAQTGAHLRQR